MQDEFKEKVTEDLMRAAFAGPALNSNRYVVSHVSSGLRLAFLEDASDGSSHFRTAVLLSHMDAIKMYKLIQGLMKEIEPQIQDAMAEAEKSTADGAGNRDG